MSQDRYRQIFEQKALMSGGLRIGGCCNCSNCGAAMMGGGPTGRRCIQRSGKTYPNSQKQYCARFEPPKKISAFGLALKDYSKKHNIPVKNISAEEKARLKLFYKNNPAYIAHWKALAKKKKEAADKRAAKMPPQLPLPF